jgi:hypothetical protein
VFVARPPAAPPPGRDLHLVRSVRRTFSGPAAFLADPAARARVGQYLADMARPYGQEVPAALPGGPLSPELGQSYGEMAEPLIGSAVLPDEPVDLLVLAFSIHDLWPGRPAAAYLSHLTPGAPMAFAVCDQGSAAAFSGLRIAREYAASAGIARALLIVVEQAALPYRSPGPLPAQHQGVAMLLAAAAAAAAAGGAGGAGGTGGGGRGGGARPQARLAGLRQRPGVLPGEAAGLAAADLKELAAGQPEVGLVLSATLAGLWTAPAAGRVRVMPPGQPSTGVWWGLTDALAGTEGRPGLLVAADYDPSLRYLCLSAFETGPRPG